jgi:predicted thioesterase
MWKAPLRIGARSELSFIVEPARTIDFGVPELPPVLSTPALLWYLEQAAITAALPALEADEITLGIHVTIDHLAPTPIGRTVICQARIVNVEGAVISCQVEARDETEIIARGYHKRRIVNVGKFAQRVRRKEPGRPAENG